MWRVLGVPIRLGLNVSEAVDRVPVPVGWFNVAIPIGVTVGACRAVGFGSRDRAFTTEVTHKLPPSERLEDSKSKEIAENSHDSDACGDKKYVQPSCSIVRRVVEGVRVFGSCRRVGEGSEDFDVAQKPFYRRFSHARPIKLGT